MALPPNTPYIVNASFESGGLTGWTVSYGNPSDVSASVTNGLGDASNGSYALKAVRTSPGYDETGPQVNVQQTKRLPTYPGHKFSVSCDIKSMGAQDYAGGSVHVYFYNSSGVIIGIQQGNHVNIRLGTSYRTSTVDADAPEGAVEAEIGGSVYLVAEGSSAFIDNFRTTYTYDRGTELTLPEDGSQFASGSVVPFAVTVSGSGPALSSVEYYIDDGTPTLVGTTTGTALNYNAMGIEDGDYDAYAVVTFADATEVTTDSHAFSVGEAPEPPETREFKASNSYTNLVLGNFVGLADSIPATAKIKGTEFLVSYKVNVLSRTKDKDNDDVSNANPATPFDIAPKGIIEISMLRPQGDGYEAIGTPLKGGVPLVMDDFTVAEEGTSEEKKWTVYEMNDMAETIVGDEEFIWGQDALTMDNFKDMSFGLRFYPEVTSIPEYADSGDACYRFMLDEVRIRVYFDAGSVQYYFASPDKTQVISGWLAAAYVLHGDFRSGDASGVLQLTPTLDILDGVQEWIGGDWTVHSAYPPDDDNQIANVYPSSNGIGMTYNGLPTQQQVKANRSRYEFITENFYGDPSLNSMYGAHGLPRAFSYNGDFFYKIYTQEDATKDSPRHVANHHSHLALGYFGGRVDISVAGEPYNFNGVDGASSWAFGDKVVGLLPLSGTILGVFGSKSVQGISGTTVDNFSTQVISPNIGAIEYTICDMGFPVYANAYGIYTLSQTQEYGDYLGQPMSRDVSPWLRPRLLRKNTSDKEVVCAFPVRSKNQYRLCFSDGFVTSMTLNGQAVPTFSFQKYFYAPESNAPDDLYSYPSIVPAAVSSELDDAGEERIHFAPYDI